MKYVFLIFVCLYSKIIAQPIKKVDDKKLAGVLTFLGDRKSIGNYEMNVVVYPVRLPTDPIPATETEEFYDRLFVSVCDDGDYPRYKVYEIGPILLTDSSLQLKQLDKYTVLLKFTHGFYEKRKTAAYKISVKDFSVRKIK